MRIFFLFYCFLVDNSNSESEVAANSTYIDKTKHSVAS